MPATLAIALLLTGAQDPTPAELYKKVLPSVMTLTARLDDGTSTGTGFLAIKDGIAVTSWHVVKGAKRVMARFSTGEEFEVSGLVDKDEKRDVALIRVKVADRPLLGFAPSDPEVGSKAYVIGAPRGFEFSISDGLLSQIQNIDGMRQYQFSCPSSPGNSGGPLLDANGQVLGVVAWGRRDGQNLNFAIPGAYVKGLDSTLPTVPWANVVVEDRGNDPDAPSAPIEPAKYKKLIEDALFEGETGREVFEYILQTVVSKAGGYQQGVPLEFFEVNTAMESNEKRLRSLTTATKAEAVIANQLSSRLQRTRLALAKLRLAVVRAQASQAWTPAANDMLKDAVATHRSPDPLEELQEMLASESFLKTLPLALRETISKSDRHGYRLGLRVWPKQRSRLSFVAQGTLAHKFGLKINDILIEVDGKPIADVSDLKALVKENLGGKLRLRLRRDGKEREIELRIPKEIPKEALVTSGS